MIDAELDSQSLNQQRHQRRFNHKRMTARRKELT